MIELTKENLFKYVDENPLEIYSDYSDTITDDIAQMLLKGDFNGVTDAICDVETNLFLHAYWGHWGQELADAFGLKSFDDLSGDFQETVYERKQIDTSDYWRGCFNNYRGHVVATPRKRNGEYIEFPCTTDLDAKENRKLARYLKEACGITGDSEALYAGTVMKALGRVDFYEIWQKQKAPTGIVLSEGTFTIGHHPNGSGTASNDQYRGKPRKYQAEFTIDGMEGYGVDDTFGLVERVWNGELELVF